DGSERVGGKRQDETQRPVERNRREGEARRLVRVVMAAGGRLVLSRSEEADGVVDPEGPLLGHREDGLEARQLVGIGKRRKEAGEIDREDGEPGHAGDPRPTLLRGWRFDGQDPKSSPRRPTPQNRTGPVANARWLRGLYTRGVAQRGRVFLAGLAVTILFALPLLPEIAGARRLVFRDAHITHWPWRRIALRSLASGEVPFVNLSASGGQPLLANPNAGLLYPTVLLEKVFAPAAAFNLHYLLHVLWAFFGARALARRLGVSSGAGFFSATAFAFSGMMMSYASAFANSGAAAAWLPWCAAAAVDLARANGLRQAARASAAAALAFGLQLLAGEPALSLLTILFAGFLAAAVIFSSGERSLARTVNVAAGGGGGGGFPAGSRAGGLLPPRGGVLLASRRRPPLSP